MALQWYFDLFLFRVASLWCRRYDSLYHVYVFFFRHRKIQTFYLLTIRMTIKYHIKLPIISTVILMLLIVSRLQTICSCYCYSNPFCYKNKQFKMSCLGHLQSLYIDWYSAQLFKNFLLNVEV